MGVHQRFFPLAAQDHREWTERERRYAVRNQTVVTTAAGHTFTALVSNLSNKGCRIVTPAPLHPGETLTLAVEPLGLLEATVRWTSDGDAGLELGSRDAFHSDYEFSCTP